MADITQESGVCSILKRGNLHFIGCRPLIIPPRGSINGHIYLCCTLVLCVFCDWDWQIINTNERDPFTTAPKSVHMELLSFLCFLLLGGVAVSFNTSTCQQLSCFTRLFQDFQLALEADWTPLLDDVWHTTGSSDRSNSISGSRTSSRPSVPKSRSTSSDGGWLSAFLGQSQSSLYGSLWVSLRCWPASSGEHACPPSSCSHCVIGFFPLSAAHPYSHLQRQL